MRALPSLLLAAGLAFSAPSQAEPQAYRIDANHSTIVASWEHFGFSRTVLQFTALEGQIVHDPEQIDASRVDVQIPLSGMLTGVPDFRDHLASQDFFDVAKHATARFTSTSVASSAPGRLTVVGNLTLKGITRPVTLDVTLNKSAIQPMARRPGIGFSATAMIRRSDFDMGAYAPNVGDEVKLEIFVEAIVPASGT